MSAELPDTATPADPPEPEDPLSVIVLTGAVGDPYCVSKGLAACAAVIQPSVSANAKTVATMIL